MSNVITAQRMKPCNLCNKLFNTKKAVADHKAAVHNVKMQGVQRSLRSYVNAPTRPQNKVNIDGTAYQKNQAANEALFGSSALTGYTGQKSIMQMRNRGQSGIQQALANIVGATPEGRAWALAALHPCGAGEVVAHDLGVLNGMCDTMTSSVATPVYRGENFISYQPSLFTNIPNPVTTYGVDIIVPPIPEIDFMYRLIDDSTGQKTNWIVKRLPEFTLPQPSAYPAPNDQYVGYNENTTFTTMASTGYGKIRQIAVGHTFELDASGLNDQGRVVVGQMEGQWRYLPLTVPRVDTQSKEFVTVVDPLQTAPAITYVETVSSQSTSNAWLLEIPTDPAVIASSCPNAYQGLAKHGAYVVQKFTSPLLGYAFKRTGGEGTFLTSSGPQQDVVLGDTEIVPYMPVTALALATNTQQPADLSRADNFFNKTPYDARTWSGFGQANLPVGSQQVNLEGVDQSALHPGISEPSDMMTAVILFRNLPAGGTSGVTASIRIKSRNYYEAISNGTNPAVAPYIHPPAQFDFQALNSVIIAGKQLADAYPACDNSLSLILGKVWDALRTYVKPVASTVGKLNIPIASGIANMLDFGIDSAETGLDRYRHLRNQTVGL